MPGMLGVRRHATCRKGWHMKACSQSRRTHGGLGSAAAARVSIMLLLVLGLHIMHPFLHSIESGPCHDGAGSRHSAAASDCIAFSSSRPVATASFWRVPASEAPCPVCLLLIRTGLGTGVPRTPAAHNQPGWFQPPSRNIAASPKRFPSADRSRAPPATGQSPA